MKRTIRLKESELKRMITESVRRVLKEGYGNDESNTIIKALSRFPYFWHVDFDKNAYNLPDNWDELDQYERAKIVYYQSDMSDDEWMDYLPID